MIVEGISAFMELYMCSIKAVEGPFSQCPFMARLSKYGHCFFGDEKFLPVSPPISKGFDIHIENFLRCFFDGSQFHGSTSRC
jgi:hypothetical protein